MYWLVIGVLVLAAYAAMKLHALGKAQFVVAQFLETQFKELRDATKKEKPPGLPYGWFDDGFSPTGSDEEERAAIENPTLRDLHDDFTDQMWIAEYHALPTPHERVKYLRALTRQVYYLPASFLDLAFGDNSVFVRSWAAGHLTLEAKDYTDPNNAVQIRDYQKMMLEDPEAVVRAAVWSNPQCRSLPWHSIWVSDNWKDELRKMSQLERLGLMRNPELSERYIVKLLETSSEELGITVTEHVAVLRAAVLNPDVIGSSRRTGRKFWMVMGDVNPPFEYFGTMWDLALDRWREHLFVAYLIFRYVQTTPEKKTNTYHRLLNTDDDKNVSWLREEIIRSCDPIEDAKLLKLAWSDPEEKCREIAKVRVGEYSKFVGVEKSLIMGKGFTQSCTFGYAILRIM